MTLLLALLACREPEQVTLGGRSASVAVTLLNPTQCNQCDPWRGVETLRVRVLAGADVIAEATFPREGDLVLPDLPGFGVVRVELEGLGGGQVRSAGRSAEVVLGPDVVAEAPMVFLPVNRALPLKGAMGSQRSGHLALTLRDGRVALMGGESPDRARSFPTAELFDPGTGTFAPSESPLPAGVADPSVTELDDGGWLVAGGRARTRNGAVAVRDAWLVDVEDAAVTAVGDLNVARAGGCLARFRERQGVAFGGADGDVADYLKPVDGSWAFDAVPIRDFAPAAVDTCFALDDGHVLVLGEDPASTGIWAPVEGGDPGASFRPFQTGQAGALRHVSGATVVPVLRGAWVVGGVEEGSVQPVATTRIYDAEGGRFEEGPTLATARVRPQVVPLGSDGVMVVGCGEDDAGATELVDLRAGNRLPVIAMDRARPGCTISVLDDGSVLFAGGWGAGGGSSAPAATAALAVPWLVRE